MTDDKAREVCEAMGCKLVEASHDFEIPASVAKCPICDGVLYAGTTGWTQMEDSTWAADCIEIDCETEPDIDGPDWEDWFTGHYAMPYVDWLPVDLLVREWMTANYRFRM